MGRHKLPYKMKKPNQHHRYWRYVLSIGPRTEISTKTRAKYEAERIAKEAYQKSLIETEKVITFGEYSTRNDNKLPPELKSAFLPTL